MRKVKWIWNNFEEVLAAIIVLVMAIVTFINIVGRFIFKHSFSWADDLTMMLFLWTTMLGAAIAFKYGKHFNMGLLGEHGGKKRHITLAVVSLVANVLFSAGVFYLGILMVQNQLTYEGIIPTLHISQAWQGIAIPFGAFFMIIRSVEGFLNTLKKEEGRA